MRKDPIVVLEHDPTWSRMFEEQRRRVERVLDSWLLRPVDHIGSTAVPSLAAKPIIDMLAVVGDIDAKTDAVPAMHSIAWVHAPEPLDRAERKVSFCFPTVARRTHHLHIVEERCAEWPKWLAFRDYLIDHPDVASTYADLKQQLAAEHGGDPNDRQAYRLGKTTFCESVTARARSEGYDPRAR